MIKSAKNRVLFSALAEIFFSVHGRKDFLFALIFILFAACLEGLNISLVFVVVSALLEPDLPEVAIVAINFLSSFIDPNYDVNREGSEKYRLVLLLMLPPVYVAKNFTLFLINKYLIFLAAKVQEDVGLRLYRNYLALPYSTWKATHSSTLIRNIVTEVSNVSTIVESFLLLLSEMLVLLTLGGIIFWLRPEAALVTTFFVISCALLFYFVCIKRLKVLGERRQYVEGIRLKQLKESFSCIREVKIFDKEHYFFKLFSPTHVEHSQNVASSKLIMRIPSYFIETFMVLVGAVVVVVTVLSLGGVTEALPYLSLFMLAMMRVAPSLGRINLTFSTLKLYMPVVVLLDEELKKTSISEGTVALKTNTVTTSLQQKGVNADFKAFELRDIKFSYSSGELEVLRGITLRIKKGDCIGIVGVSGSGKSTLLDVLIGLLDPCSGTKILNGEVVSNSELTSKNYFGYVPQKTFLLDDTIAKNIAFGINDEDINVDKVISALRQVNLWDHVQSLDGGIHSVVGEDGVTLSGGQSQRLNIARMLYLEAQILILDEATSALDATTEREIIRDLNSLRGNRPVVIVTHRASALAHCNKIYNLTGGKLISQGASKSLGV